jgi:hypothetical protein
LRQSRSKEVKIIQEMSENIKEGQWKNESGIRLFFGQEGDHNAGAFLDESDYYGVL